MREPLTRDSLEVILAANFLRQVAGSVYTDDIMDKVISDLNAKILSENQTIIQPEHQPAEPEI